MKKEKNGLKQLIAVMLCITLCMTSYVGIKEWPIYAAETVKWDGTTDISWEGNGTKSSPYLIYTAQEFAGMLSDENKQKGSYYKLMNDIDLGGFPLRENVPDGEWGGQDWKKLKQDNLADFTGIFNGNNYIIRGYYNSKSSSSGLFGFKITGSVSNFTVYGKVDSGYAICHHLDEDGELNNCNSYVEGATAIVGDCHGRISYCKNYASVCIAGIAARCQSGKIENSVNYGSVGNNSAFDKGGIVGTVSENGTIINCANYGEITGGTSTAAGGIAGTAENNVEISFCENFAPVNAANSNYVGGIAGGGGLYPTSSFKYCANYGKITGTKAVGGIAGQANRIEECFNKGTVFVKRGTSNVGGGIAGTANLIQKCYAICDINTDNSNAKAYGIGEGTAENCYYVGNRKELSTSTGKYNKIWDSYPEDGVIDINGGFDYFEVNELSKFQNGFPVLSWERGRFNIKEIKQTDVSQNSISISWTFVAKATGYEVYRKNGADMEKIADVSDNVFMDGQLKADSKYEYQVRSYLKENGKTYYGDFSDILTSYTEAEKAPTPPSLISVGDVNKDGSVNLNDVQLVLRAALGIDKIAEADSPLYDANNDDSVNLNDAQLVLRAALGIIKL